MKVAVVTPYFREPTETLRRCIDSVRAQTHPCVHYLVADGHRNSTYDDRGPALRHLALPVAHGDYGGVARTVGSLRAAADGCDAIDRAAMRAQLRDTDAYLGEWRRSVPQECSEDLEAEASALAEKLLAEYDDAKLKALVMAGGKLAGAGDAG